MIGSTSIYSVTDASTNATHERILQAAEARFRTYGYGKTTMAEIAADCEMSAANIYRFFEYKQGIAVALARRDLSALEKQLSDVAEQISEPARQRLNDIFLVNLRYLHRCWSQLPRFHELVDDICGARPEILDEHEQVKTGLIVELLREGRTRGEFAFDDPDALAQTLLMATKVFVLPSCMGMLPLEEFERRLSLVLTTLVDGFSQR